MIINRCFGMTEFLAKRLLSSAFGVLFFASWQKYLGHEGPFRVDQIKLFPPISHFGNSGMARAQSQSIK